MIVIQNNRILVNDLIQDSLKDFFIKNTIYDNGNGYSVEEKWTSVLPIVYKGEEYLAVPRLIPRKFITEITNDDTVIHDDYFIPFEKIIINNKNKPRNEIQETLLDFLIGRNSFNTIQNKPRRGLFANTGIGKTFLTLKYICGYKFLACIFCPDERALKTWIEEILKFTDIKQEEIGIIKGRNTLVSLMKSKVKHKIFLFSNKTASSLVDTDDEKLILEFFEDKKIAIKIFDEFHLYLKTIFHMDMVLNTYRTFYLTATNKMRIYKENIVMNYMSPAEECCYQQEKEPVYDFIAVKYYTNPEEKLHIKGINKIQGFDGNIYLKYLLNENYPYRDFYLNKVLHPTYKSALKKLKKPNEHKIAILVKSKEACNIVAEYLITKYPDIDLGIFNSDIVNMKDREKELDKRVIISTDKSFAGILNIYNLSVIINTIPIGSPAHIEQIVGRIRDEPNKERILYQLVDFSFQKLKNSLNREISILEPMLKSRKEILVNSAKLITVQEEED